VGPRAILDTVVKRKIPSPRWESNPSLTSTECQINNHWLYQDTQGVGKVIKEENDLKITYPGRNITE
jgi:hypothetical protein